MDDVQPLQPAMTGPELQLFRSTLRPGQSYLEFGTGGSTAAALSAKVGRIWSVDSAAEWIDRVRLHPQIAPAVETGQISLRHVDIGPVKEWGYPADQSSALRWPDYSQAIWAELAPHSLDVVLIDGRFRVACALNAVMRCRADTTILFHDFWDRPHYHEVLRFTDWVASADRMAVLKPRPDRVWPALSDAVLRYTMDQR